MNTERSAGEVKLSVNNRTSYSVDPKILQSVVEFVADQEGVFTKNLSLALVGPDTISEPHERYYGKQGPTDVLSFPYDEESMEIVLCPDEIRSRAQERERPFDRWALEVFIHGILHLVGYDHTDDEDDGEHMRKQKQLVDEFVQSNEKMPISHPD